MLKPYWLCAYGLTIRISSRLFRAEQAEMETFGVTNITTLKINGKLWKYLPRKRKRELLDELIALHKQRTGLILKV